MSFPFLQPYAGLGNSLQTAQAAGGAGGVGGWVELGRTTLGGAAANIDVSSIADKRYYMVLVDARSSSAININGRLGNSTIDTGSNYAERQSTDGGTDSTLTSQGAAPQYGTIGGNAGFGVEYWANRSANEKLGIIHGVEQNTAGAATAPSRLESVSKWVNTSNPLDILRRYTSVNTYNAGSEVVVLGWDPADSHTSNFWEELADTTFTSSGVSAQTFTAKKYLWCQFWFTSDASGNGQNFQLGDTGGIDTGSTYARRFSINGGADATSASQSKIYFAPQTGAVTHFVNMFMINNASNEKLVIIHATTNNGSGAGNVPQRRETVGKWVETTNQCDRIKIATDAGTFTGGQLKVWGSD